MPGRVSRTVPVKEQPPLLKPLQPSVPSTHPSKSTPFTPPNSWQVLRYSWMSCKKVRHKGVNEIGPGDFRTLLFNKITFELNVWRHLCEIMIMKMSNFA